MKLPEAAPFRLANTVSLTSAAKVAGWVVIGGILMCLLKEGWKKETSRDGLKKGEVVSIALMISMLAYELFSPKALPPKLAGLLWSIGGIYVCLQSVKELKNDLREVSIPHAVVAVIEAVGPVILTTALL